MFPDHVNFCQSVVKAYLVATCIIIYINNKKLEFQKRVGINLCYKKVRKQGSSQAGMKVYKHLIPTFGTFQLANLSAKSNFINS